MKRKRDSGRERLSESRRERERLGEKKRKTQ